MVPATRTCPANHPNRTARTARVNLATSVITNTNQQHERRLSPLPTAPPRRSHQDWTPPEMFTFVIPHDWDLTKVSLICELMDFGKEKARLCRGV